MSLRTCVVLLLGALLSGVAVGGCRSQGPAKGKAPAEAGGKPRLVLVIHGGAGVPPRLTAPRQREYRQALEKALWAGYQALKGKEGKRGTSLDAVEAAIRIMEDSPLFNAGKGAVFNHDGRNELDASIMEGKDKKAGAVAAVTRIKNPITAARKVMEESEHVMLVGEGAERFAISKGVEEVSPVYFWTERRWKELLKAQEKARKQLEKGRKSPRERGALARQAGRHFGTVGAVALDRQGNLAAGTSTGGLTNKRFGRVGDSPIIGAGTYADNQACAVSATGHGEIFIRFAVAHDIAARIQYQRHSVEKAANDVINGLPSEEEGVGGVIVLDAKGNFAMAFDKNTAGMFRGYITSEDEKPHVQIYRDKNK